MCIRLPFSANIRCICTVVYIILIEVKFYWKIKTGWGVIDPKKPGNENDGLHQGVNEAKFGNISHKSKTDWRNWRKAEPKC
jgi:hypothetical protein